MKISYNKSFTFNGILIVFMISIILGIYPAFAQISTVRKKAEIVVDPFDKQKITGFVQRDSVNRSGQIQEGWEGNSVFKRKSIKKVGSS